MLTGMFDRDSLIKRALETGWPFVAGLMAELRGALSAPGEGAVPRAVYFASLRTLRALESLVRRMEDATRAWEDMPDCEPCGEHICHLIEGAQHES